MTSNHLRVKFKFSRFVLEFKIKDELEELSYTSAYLLSTAATVLDAVTKMTE